MGEVSVINRQLEDFAIGKPYHENVESLDKVLETICSLTDNESLRNEFVESGSCELIVDAVRAHLKEKKILLRFASIIVAFSRSVVGIYRFNKKMKELLSDDEMASVIEKIMKIICSLAEDDATREDFIHVGVCEIVVNSVRVHLKKDEVLLRFAAFVVLFSKSKEGLRRITNRMNEVLSDDDLSAVNERLAIIAEHGQESLDLFEEE
jgi:hypothetical protein